jgi:hypothetical protein
MAADMAVRSALALVLAIGAVLGGSGGAGASGSPIAAKEVRACMNQHQLALAHAVIRRSSTTTFAFCDWPPPPYADPTGYTAIRVATVDGPGADSASGDNLAYRITSTCRLYRLAYSFGKQGAYSHLKPFLARPGLITRIDQPAKIWRGALPFYPSRGEVVVLTTYDYGLDSAACVR